TVTHAPLWPLMAYERGPQRVHLRALPLFWHERAPHRATDATFPLPLNHQRRATRTQPTLAPPPFRAGHDGAQTVAGPFLGPLYVYSRDGEGAQATVTHAPLWPLMAYERGPQRLHLRLFPLLWHERAPGSATDVVFPLYVNHERGASRTQLFLGPLYVRTVDG